jgi:hypothetical protein
MSAEIPSRLTESQLIPGVNPASSKPLEWGLEINVTRPEIGRLSPILDRNKPMIESTALDDLMNEGLALVEKAVFEKTIGEIQPRDPVVNYLLAALESVDTHHNEPNLVESIRLALEQHFSNEAIKRAEQHELMNQAITSLPLTSLYVVAKKRKGLTLASEGSNNTPYVAYLKDIVSWREDDDLHVEPLVMGSRKVVGLLPNGFHIPRGIYIDHDELDLIEPASL